MILPLFGLYTYLVNYRTILRARREERRELYETATLEILAVRESVSATGYWGSILRELYPKTLHVGRCKILCRDGQGHRIVLRCVMSEEKQRLLRDGIDRKQLTACSVTYGRFSRILRTCNDRCELADALNQRF